MAPSVSSSSEIPWSISFSGSGFLATYQLGVAQCFFNCAPWILRDAPCVLGSSAGSLVAAAVVCEINPITIRDEMFCFTRQMKTFTLGPLNPSINVLHWLECMLLKYLPPDAHQLASGRLGVAVTRLTDAKQLVISEYHSKEDVVQALLCSCFVPGYCGFVPPSFKGVHYLDGGFSGIQPIMPASICHTLTVCPFSGEMDICPADPPSLWDFVSAGATLKGNIANSFRVLNALYPMALENLEQAFHNGYKDAINFLQSNDLVPYLIIRRVSQEPLNYNQTDTWMHLETSEEEEDMKVDKDIVPVAYFRNNRSIQMDCPTQQEHTGYSPVKESSLFFDRVNNVVLGNVVTYQGMLGFPVTILSYLLPPLMLLYDILQSGHRLELLLKQGPEFIIWIWHLLRHYTFFFLNLIFWSIRKNIKDRITLIILLLQLQRVHAQYEAPQRQRHSSPYNKLSSDSDDARCRSLQNH